MCLCAGCSGPRQEALRRKLQRFNSKYGINPPIRSVDTVLLYLLYSLHCTTLLTTAVSVTTVLTTVLTAVLTTVLTAVLTAVLTTVLTAVLTTVLTVLGPSGHLMLSLFPQPPAVPGN